MSIFISYSHKNQQEAEVIDLQLREYGLNVIKDSRELGINNNIKNFMQKIKDTDFAILLISDDFIKSPNCMYEVLELIKSPNYKNRLIPIVTTDAKIYNAVDISDYLEYWQDKIDELNDKLKSQKYATSSQAILDDLNHFSSIRNTLSEFLDHVRNIFHYAYDELKKLSFVPVAEFVDAPIRGSKKKLRPIYRRHSKAFYSLSLLVLLDRFLYYGFRVIIVIFLVSENIDGGLEWSDQDALQFYSFFTLLIYCCPLLFGLLSDVKMGYLKSFYISIVALLLGFATLLFQTDDAIYIGSLLLILGFSSVKSNGVALLGNIYNRNRIIKDEAFSLYYIFINFGAFFASLIIGYLFYSYGANSSFIALFVSSIIYFFLFIGAKKNLKSFDTNSGVSQNVRGKIISRKTRWFLLVITMLVVSIFWWVYDYFNSFQWPIQHNTSSSLAFLNSFYILIFGIPIVLIWTKRAIRNKTVTPFYKFSFGFIFLSLSCVVGYYLFSAFEYDVNTIDKDSLLIWFAVSLAFQAIADMFVSPIALSFIDSLANIKYKSTTIAVYFLCTGVSSFLYSPYIDSESIEPVIVNSSFILLIFAFIILLFKEEFKEQINKIVYR